jgi:hypothetical protein
VNFKKHYNIFFKGKKVFFLFFIILSLYTLFKVFFKLAKELTKEQAIEPTKELEDS